jgi:hypothetical protein
MKMLSDAETIKQQQQTLQAGQTKAQGEATAAKKDLVLQNLLSTVPVNQQDEVAARTMGGGLNPQQFKAANDRFNKAQDVAANAQTATTLFERQNQQKQTENQQAVQAATVAYGRNQDLKRLEANLANANNAAQQGRTIANEQAKQQAIIKTPALYLSPADTINYRNTATQFDAALASSHDALDYVSKVGRKQKVFSPSEAQAVTTDYQTNVMPILATMQKTGVLAQGEVERMMGIMGDPSRWSNLTDIERKKIQTIDKMVQQQRAAHYSQAGVQASDIPLGHSSYMQSRPSTDKGPP